ncbi:MAG: MarR family transcriptional regulator [Pseudomonadota bacterium]|nr:MarR family transcriptional regulator [Pseudomonadota bacterium]
MKAIIGITSWDASKRELLDLARRMDAGEQLPVADYHLNFATPGELLGELPPKRLATLRAIKAAGAVSIYALARGLGRNYSNVHADVRRLIEHGLVEKNADGRVFMPFEDVIVQVEASLLEAA